MILLLGKVKKTNLKLASFLPKWVLLVAGNEHAGRAVTGVGVASSVAAAQAQGVPFSRVGSWAVVKSA